jgi:hypothetical protein
MLCTYHAWEVKNHPAGRMMWTSWARGRYTAMLNAGPRELLTIIDCAATGIPCPPGVMRAVLSFVPPGWLAADIVGEVEIERSEAAWLVEGPRAYALQHLATRESLGECCVDDFQPALRSANPTLREAALRALVLLPHA